jgi:flavin-dependent dehydrogenase
VILIEKAPFPRSHIGESLIGEILPLLDVLGVRREIEEESFIRTRAAWIRWTSTTEYREFGGANGFQVDRARFDELLLCNARRAGVQILQPARVREIRSNDGRGWSLAVETPNGDPTQVDCSFLIDATGRASILGGARVRTGASTLALYAYWHKHAVQGPETRVESGQSEWFWGAPLPNGLFNGTVFIDTVRFAQGVAAAGTLDNFYWQLISSSELLAGCVKGTRVTPVMVCDATCTCAEAPMVGRSIKVGEAAFSVDPLSSQGVQLAIGSALHAAAAIHTMIEHPDDSTLARDFYVERQKQSVLFHKQAAGQFYANAATVQGTQFWRRRSIPPATPEAEAQSQQTRLPASKDLICIAPNVCLRTVPIVENAFVVPALGVVVPNSAVPIVFLEGVKAAPLIEMISAPITLGEIIQRWMRSGSISSDLAVKILRRAFELKILSFGNNS